MLGAVNNHRILSGGTGRQERLKRRLAGDFMLGHIEGSWITPHNRHNGC
jgi:hypothetical protein